MLNHVKIRLSPMTTQLESTDSKETINNDPFGNLHHTFANH